MTDSNISGQKKSKSEIKIKNEWCDNALTDYYIPKDDEKKSKIGLKIRNKWNELHYHGRKNIVDELICLNENDTCLDIGCGVGERVRQSERTCQTIGMDVNQKMCQITSKSSSQKNIIRGDAENLPLRDESISKITMIYSFVYVSNKEKVIEELNRVLKKGGTLVLFDPNSIGLKNFLVKLLLLHSKSTKFHNDPLYINRKLIINQSLNYFKFKKMFHMKNFRLEKWRGNFDTIPFLLIENGILSYVTLFMLNFWNIIGCKNWGRFPCLNFFSDFLILKFVKN